MAKGDFLGEFEQLVLLALIRVGTRPYGMTIRRELEDRTGRSVAIGAVYATLCRLKDKGYISSWTGEPTPERGCRAKRFFKLEAAGSQALNESLSAVASLMKQGKTVFGRPLEGWIRP